MCQIEELDLKSIEGKRKTSMMYKLANGMVKVSKVCALSNQVEEHRKPPQRAFSYRRAEQ
jgi:hypothetical protein